MNEETTYYATKERNFEDDVERGFGDAGYAMRGTDDTGYDRKRALLVPSLIGFVKDTQPKEWAKVEGLYREGAEAAFLDQLCRYLEHDGLIDIMRHGFRMAPGAHFDLVYFKPASGINELLCDNHAKNRFEIVRQLHYGTLKDDQNNSVDVVLFVNGLPLVTIELKNHQTGQDYQNAIEQYRTDRDPHEPIFCPNRCSLVHFAVDPDMAFMTTWLSGKSTVFLPFNRGNGREGAGNPPARFADEYRVSYLWEEMLSPQSLLDIVERYVYIKRDKDGVMKAVIFPRYHQLLCVRSLIAAAREEGPGHNYLIQHSAGSGKSYSITWLAYQLASLNRSDGNAVFDSVVVLTDRIVLDQNLQKYIYDMDHKEGVVAKIEKGSGQLLAAVNSGKRIIISTIQKFPHIYRDTDVGDKTFAIIIDEAHSSQSGEAAKKTRAALGDRVSEEELERELVDAAAEEFEPEADAQADLVSELAAQGPQKTLSFFAFTATPKPQTLELFGRKGDDGKPHPFSLYSMKQAIDEGFILDVLRNYTTFDTYFKLVKAIPDDPRYAKMAASKSLMNFVKLHPANIERKAAIMIEHFRNVVMHKLDGRAKAMVVTSSRLAAVRYAMAFRRYIEAKRYRDVNVLIAFSGSVDDGTGPRTEAGMNGFPDTQTAQRFDTDSYNVMIVANKFQTGFDQPYLCAMYVDKVLTGIAAVQTLSRLNRTCPGHNKEVFVLDFVNDWDTIKAAFDDYYTVAEIDRNTDYNVVYQMERRIEGYHVYDDAEVNDFAAAWYGQKDRDGLLSKIEYLLEPAKARYAALDDKPQFEFHELVKKFLRSYSFVTQMIALHDEELQRLYVFLTCLYKEFPKISKTRLDLSGDVDLASIHIEDMGTEAIPLAGGTELRNPGGSAGVKPEDPEEPLSAIIDNINNMFDMEFGPADKILEACMDTLCADPDLVTKAKNNTMEDFAKPFSEALTKVLMKMMKESDDFFEAVGNNKDMLDYLGSELLKLFYKKCRE